MKILVISDSHGHIVNLKIVMEIAKKANISAIIHAGDWNNIKSVETILSYGIPLYTIMGNADIDDGMEEYMSYNVKGFDRDFLKIELDGRKIGVTHRIKKDDPRFEGLDTVFNGHYHSAEEKMINFTKFVRPGALVNGINFVVYETTNGGVEFIKE